MWNIARLDDLRCCIRSHLRASDVHLLVFADSLGHQDATVCSYSPGHIDILCIISQIRTFIYLLILGILHDFLLELALSKFQLILGEFQINEILSNCYLARWDGPFQLASDYD